MFDKIAAEFLELSSEQRLKIIATLKTKKSKLSELAKNLDSTTSEMHRNLNRLTKAQMISKGVDGNYHLTSYGDMLYLMIPSLRFFVNNRKFFSNHGFGNLPPNYIQTMGSLADSEHIAGFVRVQECWKKIYKNSTKYIYGMLHEVSYETEIISILKEKINKGVHLHSIFSEGAVFPSERERIVRETQIDKLMNTKNVQRKIGRGLDVLIVLNEKEAFACFPTSDGKIDVSEGFYGDSSGFHDWCLSFFEHNWEHSTAFFDERLKKSKR